MISITAAEINHILQGRLEGDPSAIITHTSKIEESTPDSICFFGNPKYESYVYECIGSVILVPKDFKPEKAIKPTLIRVENVYESVSTLFELFSQYINSEVEFKVSTLASISNKANIGIKVFIDDFVKVCDGVICEENVQIHSQVYLGKNVKIGEGTILYSGVKIYNDCVIGKNCIIHSNTVIGSDGFGFAPQSDGKFKKIPQLGNVIIENDVEIGANCTIDRASIGSTIIRSGVKLDNLIQVAHNVEIGENTVIAAQVGIAGSTKLGKNIMVGGQSGFAGHIIVADGTKVQGQTGVNRSVTEPNSVLYGNPAFNYRDYLKSYSIFKKLPEIIEELRRKD
jgi:UDP-3-O-[3-hydroxymyristoyl] glucosamine N-acyltransferase